MSLDFVQMQKEIDTPFVDLELNLYSRPLACMHVAEATHRLPASGRIHNCRKRRGMLIERLRQHYWIVTERLALLGGVELPSWVERPPASLWEVVHHFWRKEARLSRLFQGSQAAIRQVSDVYISQLDLRPSHTKSIPAERTQIW